MTDYLIKESSLTGIGDALRNKLSVTTTYSPAQMAEAIYSIPTYEEYTGGISQNTSWLKFVSSTTFTIANNLGYTISYSETETGAKTSLASGSSTPALSTVYIHGIAYSYAPSTAAAGLVIAGSDVAVSGKLASNRKYQYLFYNQTALTGASGLTCATILADGCYKGMFEGCTKLTTAPALPATTLTDYCYQSMFQGCKSLTTIPNLPATGTLTTGCYQTMFKNCKQFYWYSTAETGTTTYRIPPTGTATTGTNSTYQMFYGNSGTLPGSGTPAVNTEYYYLFEAVDDPGILTFTNATGFTNTSYSDLEYSTDGGSNWITFAKNDTITVSGTVKMKGFDQGSTFGHALTVTGTNVTVSGKLADSTHYENLFNGQTAITDASGLEGPDILLQNGCYGMFYNCTALTKAPSTLPATADTCYQAMFYGCTALTTAPTLPATTLTSGCYTSMFYGCTALTTPPELPATTLNSSCYNYMFQNCTALTTLPELPATTLSNYCYASMFKNCSQFYWYSTAKTGTTTYRIPPTGTATAGTSSTTDMFTGNSGALPGSGTPAVNTEYYYLLLDAPGILTFTNATGFTNNTPVALQYSTDGGSTWTTLATGGGTVSGLSGSVKMKGFNQSSASTSDYHLGITGTNVAVSGKLADSTVYKHLFYGQTAITDASGLQGADTLIASCYQTMFSGCTSLTATPTLPATTLANYCYAYMFSGCTSLTTPPALPAETLANYCYQSMFYNCTALTTPPTLPATTLATSCYRYMFFGCIGLTSLPALPATGTLPDQCYYQMFKNCTQFTWGTSGIDYTIPSSGSATAGSDSTYQMFYGNSGTLPESTGTPVCGTIYYYKCFIPTTLTFSSDSATDVVITNNTGNAAKYSLDGGTSWVDLATSASTPTASSVMVKGSVNYGGMSSYYWGIAGTNVKVSGTLLKGIRYDNLFNNQTALTDIEGLVFPTEAAYMQFQYMFQGCTGLTSIPENLLPATTLATYCYNGMFYSCTGLTSIPSNLLPATTLANSCYSFMFYGCTGLTSIPSNLLPATTLAKSCYSGMFQSCTGLTSVPETLLLPATTLVTYCYSSMFNRCTGLTSIPENFLPAETLATYCYSAMFYGCTALTTAPALPATTLAEGCYGGSYSFNGMFNGCTALTTPPALPATTLATYCYGYMFNGCTSLTSLPTLPATGTLPAQCYYRMFYNCSQFYWYSTAETGTTTYRIPPTGTATAGTDSLRDMFTGNSGTLPGSGTPAVNTEYYYKKV